MWVGVCNVWWLFYNSVLSLLRSVCVNYVFCKDRTLHQVFFLLCEHDFRLILGIFLCKALYQALFVLYSEGNQPDLSASDSFSVRAVMWSSFPQGACVQGHTGAFKSCFLSCWIPHEFKYSHIFMSHLSVHQQICTWSRLIEIWDMVDGTLIEIFVHVLTDKWWANHN